jgi:hypothetical protein
MTNIDPSRLAAIFRGLSSTESQKNTVENKKSMAQPSKDKVASIDVKSNPQRDKENLKKNIYLRLSKLKAQDAEYKEKAPAIVIKEILLWEFGESLLQHPEFNYFAQTIIDQVKGHIELETYLDSLIKNLYEYNKK